MQRTDQLGNCYSGASASSMDDFEQALREFRCYIGDPVATVGRALEDSPGFVMGHVLNAYLHLLGTEPAAIPVARAAVESANRHSANDRERAHLNALSHLLDGEWRAAARVLEDLAIDHPLDALALQAGHVTDFYTGDSRMLRDRIARALPAWSPDMPGYHSLLAMHAFGLEETALYERAEDAGRRAIELEPRDSWAQHAVAHVMEMQGRQRDGIAWMRASPDTWAHDCFFAVHNWWHLALFHLDLNEIDEVFALFDGPIYGSGSPLVLDLVDASAMLWRLHLRGLDVGERWTAIADAWAPVAAAGTYAFNDAHAMMAFVGAGRPEDAGIVLASQQRALHDAGDNAMFVRDVGGPLTRAIHAFGHGNYAETVSLLRPIRNIAHRFGGSHAQRDFIDLTLIEAALRDGQLSLARALAAERVDLKPASPAARELQRRTADGGFALAA